MTDRDAVEAAFHTLRRHLPAHLRPAEADLEAAWFRGKPNPSTPYTVTLSWTPDQNFGRVSTLDRRVPLFAIAQAARAGDGLDEIAADYDLTVEQVTVIARLAGEVGEWT